MPNSGPVDRFYFRSLYFREPNGILFEIATDGPGFARRRAAGDAWASGWRCRRSWKAARREIEAGLKPL